jgi:hypothetical protein
MADVPPVTLYDLPDGPLSIILKILMTIDPTTLVGVVARLGSACVCPLSAETPSP